MRNSRSFTFTFTVGLMPFAALAGACTLGSLAEDPGSSGPAANTFYGKVMPVLRDKCNGCHFAGGPTLSFETHDDASKVAQLIAATAEDRTMPPFPPGLECGDYMDRERWTLTDDEIAVLRTWADGELPVGAPEQMPPPTIEPLPELGEPDLRLEPSAPFDVPDNQDDLYQCFRLDRGAAGTLDLVAMDIDPDNLAVVHHVIVFRQERNGDPGPDSFPCPGVPGRSEFVFGWVPGAQPLQFDPGMAMRVEANEDLVMQVHYHITPGTGVQRDHTKLHVYTTNDPVDEYVRVVWTGSLDINIGPGQTASTGSMCQVPGDAGAIKVLGVAPHMHEVGTKFSTTLLRDAGGEECMIDIQRWDFEWQGGYMFREPILLQPGDRLRTTCDYRNTTTQQVGFGEGTTDEMCFNFIFVVDEQRSMPQFCFPPCTLLPGLCETILDLLDGL